MMIPITDAGRGKEEEEDLILTSIFLYTSAKNKQQSDIFAFDMSV